MFPNIRIRMTSQKWVYITRIITLSKSFILFFFSFLYYEISLMMISNSINFFGDLDVHEFFHLFDGLPIGYLLLDFSVCWIFAIRWHLVIFLLNIRVSLIVLLLIVGPSFRWFLIYFGFWSIYAGFPVVDINLPYKIT